jgi:hypothetical protein
MRDHAERDLRDSDIRDPGLQDSEMRDPEMRDPDVPAQDMADPEMRDGQHMRDGDVPAAAWQDADPGRAETELAGAEERGDGPEHPATAQAETDLARADGKAGPDGHTGDELAEGEPTPLASGATMDTRPGYARAGDQPVPSAADGITVGRYDGPTVPVGDASVDDGGSGSVPVPRTWQSGAAQQTGNGGLWDEATWQDLHERWREVQLGFVDDPSAALAHAKSIVDEAVDGYTQALARRRGELDGWRSAGNADTEVLRMALRQYRDFLETLH